MSLVYPLAFALLALVVPIFAAHLWRKRVDPRRVSSTLLLRKIAAPKEPPKRGVSQPKHLFSLVLLVLAIVISALAVADVRREGEAPRDLVIVLDTSASMGAKDDGTTRFAMAVDKLESILASLHTGDRVALVTTGGQNVVRVGLTEDYTSVVAIAKTLTTGGTSDHSSAALRLADGICAQSAAGRIVLLSDGVGVSVPETSCGIEHVPTGTDVPNAGISEMSVRAGDAFGISEVHIAVTSALGKAQRAEIALLAGDRVIDLAAIDLPARGKAERLLRLELPAGEELSAELKLAEPDALTDDDVATAQRAEGGRVQTVLVSPAERSFTAEALRLHPRVDLTVVKSGESIAEDAKLDLVVLEALPKDGLVPPAKHLVTFGMPPQVAGLQDGKRVERPDIVRWAFSDPLFRYVDFQGVKIPVGTLMTPGKTQRTLIDSEEGSLVLLDAQPEREVLYVGFSPFESDFVLRVGFVNFMANVVEWASSASSVGAQKGVLSGTESALNMPDSLEGANVKQIGKLRVPDLPLWRWAVLAVLGILALELVGQAIAGRRAARAAARANAAREAAARGGLGQLRTPEAT